MAKDDSAQQCGGSSPELWVARIPHMIGELEALRENANDVLLAAESARQTAQETHDEKPPLFRRDKSAIEKLQKWATADSFSRVESVKVHMKTLELLGQLVELCKGFIDLALTNQAHISAIRKGILQLMEDGSANGFNENFKTELIRFTSQLAEQENIFGRTDKLEDTVALHDELINNLLNRFSLWQACRRIIKRIIGYFKP